MAEDTEYLKKILPELAKPMPYKWRVQSFSKKKPQATCVAYIDARDVQDRLDTVCLYGWDRDHKEIKKHLFAGVGIVMPSGRISWRWDCGTESNTDAEKGEASDSFKRAAVNWGPGRFLYSLGIKYVDANVKKADGVWPYVVNGNKQVWNLTEFINGKKPPETPPKKELTFLESIDAAKKVIGETFVSDCLTSYKYNSAKEVKKEDEQAILKDLRTQAEKVRKSQGERG